MLRVERGCHSPLILLAVHDEECRATIFQQAAMAVNFDRCRQSNAMRNSLNLLVVRFQKSTTALGRMRITCLERATLVVELSSASNIRGSPQQTCSKITR